MANVILYDEAYSFLKHTDWDFTENQQDDISLIHPYPARFIESIPYKLITEIGLNKNERVFDIITTKTIQFNYPISKAS